MHWGSTAQRPCPAAASFPLLDCCSDDEEEAAPAGVRRARPAATATNAAAAEAAGLRACLAVQTKQVAALEGVVAGQAQRISQVRPASNCVPAGCFVVGDEGGSVCWRTLALLVQRMAVCICPATFCCF